jgi:hypothetical protein
MRCFPSFNPDIFVSMSLACEASDLLKYFLKNGMESEMLGVWV